MNLHIRWSIRRDLPAMLAIEQQSFPRPWNEEDFLLCLRARNAIGMVCVDAETDAVVGFFIYELHKKYFQVVNFAVAAEHRRCGVGLAMSDRIKRKLTTHAGRDRFRLFVPERNLGAQLFWRSMGLKSPGLEPSHDADDDDGYIKFVYRLPAGELTTKG